MLSQSPTFSWLRCVEHNRRVRVREEHCRFVLPKWRTNQHYKCCSHSTKCIDLQSLKCGPQWRPVYPPRTPWCKWGLNLSTARQNAAEAFEPLGRPELLLVHPRNQHTPWARRQRKTQASPRFRQSWYCTRRCATGPTGMLSEPAPYTASAAKPTAGSEYSVQQ